MHSLLPFLLVVFVMPEDKADVDYLPAVLDDRNQPVFVPRDFEYRENFHRIGMREIAADRRQNAPHGAFRHVIPIEQRLQRIGALVRELRDGALADDPHIKLLPKW